MDAGWLGRNRRNPGGRPPAPESPTVNSFISRRRRKFARLSRPPRAVIRLRLSGEIRMTDTVLAQLAALKSRASRRSQAEMARSIRPRAAALQPPLPGKPAGLPDPGIGLRRPKPRNRRTPGALADELDGKKPRAPQPAREPPDRRHAADPRMAGRRALRDGSARGFRISGPALQIAVGHRPHITGTRGTAWSSSA